MNPTVVQQVVNLPFVQVALPILIGFVTIGWWQNKRLDEMSRRFDDRIDAVGRRLDDMTRRFEDRFDAANRRFDAVERRLERIEVNLEHHGERITRLEERGLLVRA
jgi:predicted RNase H-like nuclease (RuvC/YqgF family)